MAVGKTRRECLCALLVVVSLLSGSRGQTASIVEAPQDTTAPLGSNATFTCRVVGTIQWQVDGLGVAGTMFDSSGIFITESETIGDNSSSVLTVLASEQNDNVLIRCVASVSGSASTDPSPEVRLTVFGLPGSPTALVTSPTVLDQLTLSWTAPSTVPGENINYTVTVTNLNSSEVRTFEDLMVTQLEFERGAGDGACDVYEFVVCAENVVGLSETCPSVNESLPSVPGRVEDVTPSFSLESGPQITLMFQTPFSCPDYPVTSYTVQLDPVGGGSTFTVDPSFTMDGTTVSLQINGSDGVMENIVYLATVTANGFQSSTPSEPVQIITTDVQGVSATAFSNGTVEVTCQFAPGTIALGCSVQLSYLDGAEMRVLYSANISREGGSLVAEQSAQLDIPSQSLSVSAVDWEADGSVGSVGPSQLDIPVIDITTPSPTPGSSSSTLPPTPTPTPSPNTAPTQTPTLPPSSSPSSSPSTSSPSPSSSSDTPSIPPSASDEPSEQGLSSENLFIIIVCVVAVIVLLLLIIGVTVIIICVRTHRKKAWKLTNGRDANVYYVTDSAPLEAAPLPPTSPKELEVEATAMPVYETVRDTPKANGRVATTSFSSTASPTSPTSENGGKLIPNPMYGTQASNGDGRPIPVHYEVAQPRTQASNGDGRPIPVHYEIARPRGGDQASTFGSSAANSSITDSMTPNPMYNMPYPIKLHVTEENGGSSTLSSNASTVPNPVYQTTTLSSRSDTDFDKEINPTYHTSALSPQANSGARTTPPVPPPVSTIPPGPVYDLPQLPQNGHSRSVLTPTAIPAYEIVTLGQKEKSERIPVQENVSYGAMGIERTMS